MPADAFWQPLYAELTRLSQSDFRPTDLENKGNVSQDRLTTIFSKHPLARSLRPDFLAALSGIAGANSGGPKAKLRALYWDLFMALWGQSPNADCAEALEAMQLTRIDPGFLGFD